MTNFEHMRESLLKMVAALDWEELRQLSMDTCMDEGNNMAVFSCSICEEVFGDCDTLPEGSGCKKKYFDWCGMEYKPDSEWEDKAEIVDRLSGLLKATRMGSNINKLALSENRKLVEIRYKDGTGKLVNIECDSGYAIIKDVLAALR